MRMSDKKNNTRMNEKERERVNERGKRNKNKCMYYYIEKSMHCVNLPLLLRELALPFIEICKFVGSYWSSQIHSTFSHEDKETLKEKRE